MDNYNYNMLFFVDNIDNKIKLNENIKNMDQNNDLKTLIIDHQNILK